MSGGGFAAGCEIFDSSFVLFFVSFSVLVGVSSPDGEVTGQRSWSSRRKEPVFPTHDGRQGDASMHHILFNRYPLLELIYPGFWLRIVFEFVSLHSN